MLINILYKIALKRMYRTKTEKDKINNPEGMKEL